MESVASVPKVVIRRVREDDLPYLMDLRNRLVDHFLSPVPATLEKTFDLLMVRGITWLLTVDGQPAGCYSLYNRFGAVAEFGRFMLDPDLQGNGYGQLMMDHAIERARHLGLRKLSLVTKMQNAAARGLYADVGFKISQIRMEMDLGSD